MSHRLASSSSLRQTFVLLLNFRIIIFIVYLRHDLSNVIPHILKFAYSLWSSVLFDSPRCASFRGAFHIMMSPTKWRALWNATGRSITHAPRRYLHVPRGCPIVQFVLMRKPEKNRTSYQPAPYSTKVFALACRLWSERRLMLFDLVLSASLSDCKYLSYSLWCM